MKMFLIIPLKHIAMIKSMKLVICLMVSLLISVSISAQQPAVKSKPGQQGSLKLTNADDTLQYSLGVFIGQWMVSNSFAISNTALFNRGIEDFMQNKPRAITDSTVAPIIAAYQLSTQKERSRQMEEQLFAGLKGKPGIGVLPNGVHYSVVKQGTGIRPVATDTIVINTIGVFPDGTVFEDTYQKKQPITIITAGLIPGLNEAIQLMPVGSVWRIFVPSALAYGPAGLEGVIPGGMALVFDISLEEVRR